MDAGAVGAAGAGEGHVGGPAGARGIEDVDLPGDGEGFDQPWQADDDLVWDGRDTPAVWELVADSALAYVNGLDQAARLALHRRQSARLAEYGRWLEPGPAPHPGPDAAFEVPVGVVGYLHGRALALARAHADEIAAHAAAWYARAALTACQAIRAGDHLTGRDLENAVFDPTELPAITDQPAGYLPPWRPQYRPDLPDPAELATGQLHLDEAVADIHGQLTTAYQAAQTAEILGELTDQTDPGAGQPGPTPEQRAALEQATQLADQIPDLLTWWAATLTATLHHQPHPSNVLSGER